VVRSGVSEVDLTTRIWHFYVGSPIRREDERRFGEVGQAVREATFPKINWRD
jgi:hypothetical protein